MTVVEPGSSQRFIWISHMNGRGPEHWATFCSSPRGISRQQDPRWSSQDSYRCSYEMPALYERAQSAGPNADPTFIFFLKILLLGLVLSVIPRSHIGASWFPCCFDSDTHLDYVPGKAAEDHPHHWVSECSEGTRKMLLAPDLGRIHQLLQPFEE